MAEYLILAENITFKNGKLSCINVYDKFTSVAMPAVFNFDLVVICGPNWSEGEHKLSIKAKVNDDKIIEVGDLVVNIPNEGFVYNAYAQDLKVAMDYSVQDITFLVYDGDNEILSRKYMVTPLLVPQKQQNENQDENQQQENNY